MSNLFLRLLGSKGVGALERLMGLILVMLSTQMFPDGVRAYMSCRRLTAPTTARA